MRNIDARVPPRAYLTLTITEDQASVLAAILAQVSGPPSSTRRGLVDPIYEALQRNGIKHTSDDIVFRAGRAGHGCLVFEPS